MDSDFPDGSNATIPEISWALDVIKNLMRLDDEIGAPVFLPSQIREEAPKVLILALREKVLAERKRVSDALRARAAKCLDNLAYLDDTGQDSSKTDWIGLADGLNAGATLVDELA